MTAPETAARTQYDQIGRALPTAVASQMFGKPCLKANGKAFAAFFQDAMVFKLTGDPHTKALGLRGAVLFDPSGKQRPMKDWVVVPFSEREHWRDFAAEALKQLLAGLT